MSRIRVVLTMAILVLPLHGSMRAPSIAKIFSSNGEFYFQKIPGRYFADSSEQFCKGLLYRVYEDSSEELIWSRFLPNKSSPAAIMVKNDGKYVITFGDWGAQTEGNNVVIIYGPSGDMIRQYSIEDIAPGNDIVERHRQISGKTYADGCGSNLHWGGRHYIIEDKDILVLKVIKNCKHMVSGSRIHYDVGIELATGNFVNIDSILGEHLTEEDKAEIYDKVLEFAVKKRELSLFEWIEYQVFQSGDTSRFAFDENVEWWLIPNVKYNLTVLYPEYLQKLAGNIGNFLYIHFNTPIELQDSVVSVHLSATWATHPESSIQQKDQAGLWLLYHKIDDEWELKKHWTAGVTDEYQNEIQNYIHTHK